MIHPVRITAFDPAGTVTFTLAGKPMTAAHQIPAEEAEGLITAGNEYPLELELVAAGEVEYLPGPDTSYSQLPDGKLRVCGRCMDYFEHDLIRLEGDLTVAVRLRLPQQSTDYRRGSWLAATGTLRAAFPSPDHDEAGLKGSIVE